MAFALVDEEVGLEIAPVPVPAFQLFSFCVVHMFLYTPCSFCRSCWWVPCSTNSPLHRSGTYIRFIFISIRARWPDLSMTRMLSQCTMEERRCATVMVVRSSAALRNVRTMSRSAKASTDDVTSSHRIRVGSRSSALRPSKHREYEWLTENMSI